MGRKPTSKTKRNVKRREEYGRERTLEKLALFEEFQDTFLPQLQKLMKEGADSERMRTEMHPILTAKLLSMAITEKDTGKALAVIKDQLDRVEGKAKERVEQTHKFEKMDETALEALLKAKLDAAATDEDEARQEH